MLSTLAVIVQGTVAVFELGVMCEIFGVDPTSDGVPAFDFRVCTPTPDIPLMTPSGIAITASHSLRRHFIREIGLTPHEYRRTFAG